jgi:AraC family transcriptional regulator
MKFYASGSSSPGALGGPAFARVQAYVEDNVGQHLSLEQLAAVAGVSRFHFARQFRLRTGESPMGYVRRSRVERAKAMLRSGEATVGEIAAVLGFADQSHFTRTFRRLVGTSPRSFATCHGA